DNGGAVDAIAFVTDFFVVGAFQAASAALDGAVDVVLGHIGPSRLVDRQPEARVGGDVAAAHTGCYRDFLDETGPDFAALGIGGGFFMLDVGPFTVSCHEIFPNEYAAEYVQAGNDSAPRRRREV